MKNTKLFFWIFTGLFSAFMIFTAIPDLFLIPEAEVFMKQLGYPNYFTRFIGAAKILGSVALLIPGISRLKEWAYAGLAFDLIGAVYSVVAVNGFDVSMLFLVLPFTLLILSYRFHHKLLKQN